MVRLDEVQLEWWLGQDRVKLEWWLGWMKLGQDRVKLEFIFHFSYLKRLIRVYFSHLTSQKATQGKEKKEYTKCQLSVLDMTTAGRCQTID